MKNYFFVVIEGIDNSGKTYLIQLIKEQLKLNENSEVKDYFGDKIYFTSEPYGPNNEEKYLQLSKLIFSDQYHFTPESEAYLFLAMRADHLSNFIIPKLKENSLIFCDRYYLSTIAYQSFLKKIDITWLNLNMQYISQDIKPLITFVLEVSEQDYSKFKDQKNLNNDHQYDEVNSLSYQNLVSAYDWSIKYLKDSGEEVILIPNYLDWSEKAGWVISYIKKLIK